MKTIAVYPGSFDPPTFGHLDIIARSSRVFSRVIVSVAKNLRKDTMFTAAERLAMLRTLTRSYSNVEVDSFRGLLIEYVRHMEAHVVVRGLRAISDFEYEFQMALTNSELAPDIETVFLMTSEHYAHVSSRFVKEIARLGAELKAFVTPSVQKRLRKKLKG